MEQHPPIDRLGQEILIDRLLLKYRDQRATPALKSLIWDELTLEKHLGRVVIPFKVILRKDPTHLYPDVIEVLLDSKV